MSEWKKVKFLDVVFLNPRVSLEKGAVYPFVEMSNAVSGARKPEKDVYQKYSGGGAKFEEGDTVVARIEPCLQNGKGFQCSYKKGFGSTEFLVFRPLNLKEMDCDYLYYYMGQQSIREAMAKTMVGASGRQRVNNAVFNDLQINLPPLKIQQEIASILSRYDSLIENYQKQIKLLEEAAQRLYKEWFVDLRFPGHENTKMVDGLPEGWEKKKAIDFFEMSIGKTPPRAEKQWFTDGKVGVPWVSISDMKDVTYLLQTSEGLTKEACEKHNVKIIDEGTVLLSFKLTVGRVSIAGMNVCTNEAIAHFDKNGDDWREYTLLYLRNYNYDTLGNTSGISKAVNSTIVKNMPFLMPSGNVLDAFSNVAKPLFQKIKNLSFQIRLLTEARDRLLPRLMCGEIKA